MRADRTVEGAREGVAWLELLAGTIGDATAPTSDMGALWMSADAVHQGP